MLIDALNGQIAFFMFAKEHTQHFFLVFFQHSFHRLEVYNNNFTRLSSTSTAQHKQDQRVGNLFHFKYILL